MSIFYMFLAFLFNVGVMLLLSAAILVAPIFHVTRNGRQWTPAGAVRRNSVRVIETVQFAIGLIVLGVMWTSAKTSRGRRLRWQKRSSSFDRSICRFWSQAPRWDSSPYS